MSDFFRSFDSCVGDACAFLDIERPAFFDLASQWPHYVARFGSFPEPEAYYRGFCGDAGRSNLCVNILDQFGRFDIAGILPQLPAAAADGRKLTLADIGCGAAALSFPLAERYDRVFLIDLPNLAQDFIDWRARRLGVSNIFCCEMAGMTAQVDVMINIDVLEHIPRSSNFFREMDDRLAPGGILVLRAPWRSIAPHPEHLAEAEADWNEAGGAQRLQDNYDLVHPLAAGGIYRKKAGGIYRRTQEETRR
jgi:SAM-dependent methyltransferase